jgi:hypothetical protein
MEAAATAEGLLLRKGEIENRLQELGDQSVLKNPSPIPVSSVDNTATTATTSAEITTTTTKKRVGRKSTRKNTVHGEEDRDKQDDSNNSNNNGNNHHHQIPFVCKTDTHWDFVMKEMMWLGADFQGERKRQVSLAKKMALRYVLVCG